MKKNIIVGVFAALILLILIKYFTSNYEIKYKLDNYDIKTIYNNGRYYISIDDKYSFDIYKSRGLSRLKIGRIKEINKENYKCIIPVIKNINISPLCYYGEEYVDYNLIDDEEINKYKTISDTSYENSFYFNKNLTKKEYVYLWNYKGFYKMNNDKLEDIELFSEGKYDNSLMYQINNKIIFPNYNEEYEFFNLYVLNMINGKYEKITSEEAISYNSYVVGNIKNKLYLYDIKNSNLYEINISKLTIKLVGSESLGYYDYKSKETVKSSEYKNKNIMYETIKKSNYTYNINNNKLYKSINEDNLNLKIYEGENIKVISEYKDIVYFISDDKLYKYDSKSIYKIFNYFELKFNENNIIYTYNQ